MTAVPLTDQAYLIENMLMIADKKGEDVPFILNSAQRAVDANWEHRMLVPKARQEGVSSFILGWYLMECLTKRNVHAVVISHDQESTQRMFKKVKYYINSMNPLPQIETSSANMITFPKTGSMFYIGTAGARKFGRGDTISHLHCSEYAFWPNPHDLITGLFQAVPFDTGIIVIESTGNGFNDYHERCIRAYESDESTWKCIFLPWHEFDEYQMDISPAEAEEIWANPNVDMEEDLLLHVLTPEQMKWRRFKLEELSFDLLKFKQEYPMTLDECFQASGESVFQTVNYVPTQLWEKSNRPNVHTLGSHPHKGSIYSFGADVAGGVGQDYSVISGICVTTGAEVFQYRSSKINPKAFGYKIYELLEDWGHPFLVVENNNHGVATLGVLQDIYPNNKLYTSKPTPKGNDEDQLMNLGYKTSARTKPLLINNLRESLESDIVIHSVVTRNELSTFIEDENGKLSAQGGCYDDAVMALACAVRGFPQARDHFDLEKAEEYKKQKHEDPLLVDIAIEELTERYNDNKASQAGDFGSDPAFLRA